MKIVNIDREILHNFWTTWGISMKFSGKMCLMIILKVAKNQVFILSLEDTIFEKPQWGSVWLPPFPPAVLGLNNNGNNYHSTNFYRLTLSQYNTAFGLAHFIAIAFSIH